MGGGSVEGYAMNELDNLRPEVRSALGAIVRADVCRDPVPTDAFDTIRAELLRRNREISELRSICAATYQAAGCYGLPERFKDALSNGATGERIHDVDVDHLLPVFPTDWVERAERAEAKLAALKARIFQGVVLDVDDLSRGHAGLPSEWRGKRVRLVVENENG